MRSRLLRHCCLLCQRFMQSMYHVQLKPCHQKCQQQDSYTGLKCHKLVTILRLLDPTRDLLVSVNVECLEGQFDTWVSFGRGFVGNLSLGGACISTPSSALLCLACLLTFSYSQSV